VESASFIDHIPVTSFVKANKIVCALHMFNYRSRITDSIDNTLKLPPRHSDKPHEACGMPIFSLSQKAPTVYSLPFLSTTWVYSSPFLPTTTTSVSMLFLLLVYSLTQSGPSDANPIPSIPSITLRTDVSCNDLNNCRTISSIVWSCFSTIFLCTWVTLHPNITIAPDTRGIGRFEKVVHPLLGLMRNKLALFLCAFLAPEYILAWAIRQYLSAGNLKQQGAFYSC